MPQTPIAKRTAAEQVAEVVRSLMREKSISQTELGAKLGRSQHAVSRRLLGKLPFSIAELEVIADELEVPLAELITPKTEAGHPDQPR